MSKRIKKVKANKKITTRSKFEASIVKQLDAAKVKYQYEKVKLKYTVPEKEHTYVPDFVLSNGIVVECKGLFDSDARHKMLRVIEQNEQEDIRMVFMRDQTIRKNSKTKYSDWCNKYGIKYAFKQIPKEWLDE